MLAYFLAAIALAGFGSEDSTGAKDRKSNILDTIVQMIQILDSRDKQMIAKVQSVEKASNTIEERAYENSKRFENQNERIERRLRVLESGASGHGSESNLSSKQFSIELGRASLAVSDFSSEKGYQLTFGNLQYISKSGLGIGMSIVEYDRIARVININTSSYTAIRLKNENTMSYFVPEIFYVRQNFNQEISIRTRFDFYNNSTFDHEPDWTVEEDKINVSLSYGIEMFPLRNLFEIQGGFDFRFGKKRDEKDSFFSQNQSSSVHTGYFRYYVNISSGLCFQI